MCTADGTKTPILGFDPLAHTLLVVGRRNLIQEEARSVRSTQPLTLVMFCSSLRVFGRFVTVEPLRVKKLTYMHTHPYN